MDLTFLYPSANIWLVGHSLGGSLASLLGATFGLPAIAFEAPGERLAAQRLHLPLPPPVSSPNSTSPPSPTASLLPNIPRRRTPSTAPLPVTHIYHTADPIPQGTCTGPLSPCAQGGYALETRCHLGKSIVYDTVGVLGWRVDIRKHVIREVVEKVLGWEDGWPDEDAEGEAASEMEMPKITGVFRWVKKFWWGWGGKKHNGSDAGERPPPPPRLRDVPRAKEEVDCEVSILLSMHRYRILIHECRIVSNGSLDISKMFHPRTSLQRPPLIYDYEERSVHYCKLDTTILATL